MIIPPRGVPRGVSPLGDSLVTFSSGRKSPGARGWKPRHGWSAEEGFALLALVGAGALGPCKKNRGEPQYPLHLYPETNKKLHPNVQPSNKKISPPRGKICAAQQLVRELGVPSWRSKKSEGIFPRFFAAYSKFSGAFDIPSRSRAPCCGCAWRSRLRRFPAG